MTTVPPPPARTLSQRLRYEEWARLPPSLTTHRPGCASSGASIAAAAAAAERAIEGEREQLGDRRMMLMGLAAALDFDADAGGVRLDGELLHADAGMNDPRVLEADGSDPPPRSPPD
jgi:hypothetical protein